MKFAHFKRLICLLCTFTLSLSITACNAGSTQDTAGLTTENPESSLETAELSEETEILSFSLPTQAEESSIYVEPIPEVTDEFIRGMDASAVLAEEKKRSYLL